MTIIIKISGKMCVDRNISGHILADAIKLKKFGHKIAIVHGGGISISSQIEQRGGSNRFYNGLRITDDLALQVVEEELARINTDLCAQIEAEGCAAYGYTGQTPLFHAEKLKMRDEDGTAVDLGHVGEVASLEGSHITELLDSGAIPVVASLAKGAAGEIYNINADTAAGYLAGFLAADWFFLLSDVSGVYTQVGAEKKYAAMLNIAQAKSLIADGSANGGMIPKLDCCITALEAGVSNVVIGSGMETGFMPKVIKGEATTGTVLKKI